MRVVGLIFALIFCLFAVTSSEISTFADEGREEATLALEQRCLEDGVIEVSLVIVSEQGVCGLLATLEYDKEALELVYCGVAEQNEGKIKLSYNNSEGRVVFVLDGKRNSEPCGKLISFYFKVNEAHGGGTARLLPISDRCAFYVDGEGEIKALSVGVRGATVDAGGKEEQDEFVDIPPRLCALTVSETENGLLLNITGENRGVAHFAIGFKIFAVDVEEASARTLVVARATDGETAFIEATLLIKGRACVVITPLSFNGRAVVEGQKQVFLFE